jgi:hypothetical protein
MKQFDIKEYNKMCAEFLGYVNLTPDDPDFDFYEHPTEAVKLGEHIRKTLEPASMLFHTDWNWIMTVVEKIKPIVFMSKTRPLTDHNTNLLYALMSAKKELVVKMIWEFLNWYQEQSKPKTT